MTIKIDYNLCSGCPNSTEAPCMRICPGDLFFRKEGEKAYLRNEKDCWDCAACLKVCPNQALAMYLPIQIGGKGAILKAKQVKDKILWLCRWPDGREELFEIEAEKII